MLFRSADGGGVQGDLENDAYIKGVLPCAFGSLVTGSNPLQIPDQIRGANAAQGDAGAAEYAASAEVRNEGSGKEGMYRICMT